MPAGDARAEYAAMLRAKAGLGPHDPGEPEVLTVARLPTERERVGAELVRYRERDYGPVEWHVDIVDREARETLVSLQIGQALALQAQLAVVIRRALAARANPTLTDPDDELHDEGREDDPPGVGW